MGEGRGGIRATRPRGPQPASQHASRDPDEAPPLDPDKLSGSRPPGLACPSGIIPKQGYFLLYMLSVLTVIEPSHLPGVTGVTHRTVIPAQGIYSAGKVRPGASGDVIVLYALPLDSCRRINVALCNLLLCVNLILTAWTQIPEHMITGSIC